MTDPNNRLAVDIVAKLPADRLELRFRLHPSPAWIAQAFRWKVPREVLVAEFDKRGQTMTSLKEIERVTDELQARPVAEGRGNTVESALADLWTKHAPKKPRRARAQKEPA